MTDDRTGELLASALTEPERAELDLRLVDLAAFAQLPGLPKA